VIGRKIRLEKSIKFVCLSVQTDQISATKKYTMLTINDLESALNFYENQVLLLVVNFTSE